MDGKECPTTAPKTARRTFTSIQAMRAIAALMVVAWHAEGQMGLAATSVLQSGIEFFFIVSGFVMWLVGGESTQTPLTFWARRLARVVPLYWALTTLVLVVAVIATRVLQTIRLDPMHLFASYTFIPWPNPTPGVGLRPLIIPGWTLNYEMAFYLLVSASLFLTTRWRAAGVLGILLGATLAGMFPSLSPVEAFYTAPFAAEFALGILLAIAVKAWPERYLWIGAVALSAGIPLLIAGGLMIDAEAHLRLVFFALPVLLIVGGAALWERRGMRTHAFFVKLGDASYPLYLTHALLLSALAQGWRRVGLSGLPPFLFVAFAVSASAILGVVLHRWLEKPLTRALQTRVEAWLPRGSLGAPAIVSVPGPP